MAAATLDREGETATESRVDVVLCNIQEAQELIEQARHLLAAVPDMGSGRKRLACLSADLTCAWLAVAATVKRRRRCSTKAPRVQ